MHTKLLVDEIQKLSLKYIKQLLNCCKKQMDVFLKQWGNSYNFKNGLRSDNFEKLPTNFKTILSGHGLIRRRGSRIYLTRAGRLAEKMGLQEFLSYSETEQLNLIRSYSKLKKQNRLLELLLLLFLCILYLWVF